MKSIAYGILVILGLLGLLYLTWVVAFVNGENNGKMVGYMMGCKYKVPDGCKTCTTEEAVNSFCFRQKDSAGLFLCRIAKENMAANNTMRMTIYDANSSSGVTLN